MENIDWERRGCVAPSVKKIEIWAYADVCVLCNSLLMRKYEGKNSVGPYL